MEKDDIGRVRFVVGAVHLATWGAGCGYCLGGWTMSVRASVG